jgi:hypothetical protein
MQVEFLSETLEIVVNKTIQSQTLYIVLFSLTSATFIHIGLFIISQ